jgi:DNA excision repair protein ERCC-3
MQEMYYSTKRQQFLIDQGYSFKVWLLELTWKGRLFFWYFLVMKYCTCQVITSLPPPEEGPNLSFYTLDEQLELLSKVGAFLYPLVIVLLAITDRVQVDPFTATNRC